MTITPLYGFCIWILKHFFSLCQWMAPLLQQLQHCSVCGLMKAKAAKWFTACSNETISSDVSEIASTRSHENRSEPSESNLECMQWLLCAIFVSIWHRRESWRVELDRDGCDRGKKNFTTRDIREIVLENCCSLFIFLHRDIFLSLQRLLTLIFIVAHMYVLRERRERASAGLWDIVFREIKKCT